MGLIRSTFAGKRFPGNTPPTQTTINSFGGAGQSISGPVPGQSGINMQPNLNQLIPPQGGLGGTVQQQSSGGVPFPKIPGVIGPTTAQVRPNLPQASPQLQLPQQQQPQFGLQGAEQAFRQGAFGGAGALQTGQNNALNTLLQGFQQGQGQLNQGQRALQGNFSNPAAARGSAGSAGAVNVDPTTGQPLFQQAAQGVNRFSGAGLQAQQTQAALSGALGQDAFNQALTDSPQQQLLRQMGLEAVTNQAAATGGVGGGEVLRQLQLEGQAQASGRLNEQQQALNALSNQGLAAAGQSGQFLSQAGQQQGQLAGQNAQLGTQASIANANNATNASLQNAQLATQANIANSNRALQAAQSQAGLFGQGANLAAQLAGQGAGIQQGTGQNIAQLLAQAGGQIGGARTQAGRDISGQIGTTSSNLANLINQQGGLSDIIGQGGTNLANLQVGAGGAAGANQSQLAQLLANVSTGQGTNLSNIALQGGQTGANLAQAQGQNQRQLIGNLVSSAQFGGLFDQAP